MKVDVRDLWRSVEGRKSIKVPVRKIPFNPEIWIEGDMSFERTVTPHWIIEHAKRIQNADLSYPIILKSRGWEVLDGNHRLAKAIFEGRETIDVVRADPYYDDATDVFYCNDSIDSLQVNFFT